MPVLDPFREGLARGWTTSIGANPQLSVYGLTAQLAIALAERLEKT
ncbi:hypothetical protein J3P82_01750 [Pseudomonas sp. Z4-20]